MSTCYVLCRLVCVGFVIFLAVFKFSEVNFKDMDDIPVTLIKSVALSFREKKLVCRMCFFGDRDLSEKDFGEICNAGEHEWLKPIVVIPGERNGQRFNWQRSKVVIICSLVLSPAP